MFSIKGTSYPSWYLDEVISEEEIGELIDLIDVTRKFWNKYRINRDSVRDRLEEWLEEYLEPFEEIERNGKKYELIGIGRPLSLIRRSFPRGIHRDHSRSPDLLMKGILMLKNGNGLCLYDKDETQSAIIDSIPGRLILFDTREIHSGRTFPRTQPEYSVEFRLHYQNVD